MPAVIGQFYNTLNDALGRADELKRMHKGRVTFVPIGNDKKGYIVISETAARACGIHIPYTARGYKKDRLRLKTL